MSARPIYYSDDVTSSTAAVDVGAGQLVVAAGGSIVYRASEHEAWQGLTRFGLSAVLAVVNGDSSSLDLGLEVAAAAPHIPRQWEASVSLCSVDFDSSAKELSRVFKRVHPTSQVPVESRLIREAVLCDLGNGATLLLTEQSDASWPPGLHGLGCAVHVAKIADLGLVIAALHRVAPPGASPALLQIYGHGEMQVDRLDLVDKSAVRAFLEEHEKLLDQMDYCNRAGLLPHCRIDVTALLGDVETAVDF